MSVRVNIFFPILEVSGGGNQFLKALKKCFIDRGIYSEIQDADIVLFNSHQSVEEVISLKRKYPNLLFVHRIDGPMQLYNSKHDKRDLIVYAANMILADATIFQSKWSKLMNLERGLKEKKLETVICNASDESIFNAKGKATKVSSPKIKIIAVSWSSNINKGFEDYLYLDQNLDFDKYEFTFVGNAPCKFENIVHIQAQKSEELTKILKKHDIYITASKKEPCSNSLIEALTCGLPCIGLCDGGTPEIIKSGGLLYQNIEEVPLLVDKLVENYESIQKQIWVPQLKDISNAYYEFLESVVEANKSGKYEKNIFNIWKHIYIKIMLGYVKVFNIIYTNLKNKIIPR